MFRLKTNSVIFMIGVYIKVVTRFGKSVSSIEKNVIGETVDSLLI